jgi:hypothetical protein
LEAGEGYFAAGNEGFFDEEIGDRGDKHGDREDGGKEEEVAEFRLEFGGGADDGAADESEQEEVGEVHAVADLAYVADEAVNKEGYRPPSKHPSEEHLNKGHGEESGDDDVIDTIEGPRSPDHECPDEEIVRLCTEGSGELGRGSGGVGEAIADEEKKDESHAKDGQLDGKPEGEKLIKEILLRAGKVAVEGSCVDPIGGEAEEVGGDDEADGVGECANIVKAEGDEEVEGHFHGDGPATTDNAINGCGIDAVNEEERGENIKCGKASGSIVAGGEAVDPEAGGNGDPEGGGDAKKSAEKEGAEGPAVGAGTRVERPEEGAGTDHIEKLDTELSKLDVTGHFGFEERHQGKGAVNDKDAADGVATEGIKDGDMARAGGRSGEGCERPGHKQNTLQGRG